MVRKIGLICMSIIFLTITLWAIGSYTLTSPRPVKETLDKKLTLEKLKLAQVTEETGADLQYPQLVTVDGFYIITAKAEQLAVMLLQDNLTRNGINGGFMDNQLNPLGIVIIDGKIVAERVPYRSPRPVLILDQGQARIMEKVEQASDLQGVQYALGAGPLLVPAIGYDEEFQSDIMDSARPRAAVGLTSAGLVKILATTRNITIEDLAFLMTALGSTKAMNLDGGNSVNLQWQDKSLIKGRAISTALVFKEKI